MCACECILIGKCRLQNSIPADGKRHGTAASTIVDLQLHMSLSHNGLKDSILTSLIVQRYD